MITRSGRPSAVLLSIDEYEGLLETLEILADSELSTAVKQGLEDIESGDVLTDEEVWSDLEPALRG